MTADQQLVAFASVNSHKVSDTVSPGAQDNTVVCLHRARLVARYRQRLAQLTCLAPVSRRPAFAFMPVMLPADLASRGREVVNALALYGFAASLVPCYLLDEAESFPAPSPEATASVTAGIAARVLALPISNFMNEGDVDDLAEALVEILAGIRARRRTSSLGLSVEAA
jgi:dTDP-4-amino-4,6-dideoxygalactose transaminase